MTPENASTNEGDCEHEYEVLSYDAEIDLDPESVLADAPGPWILLQCRRCAQLTVRPYHPAFYVQYTVLPYLHGDTCNLTEEDVAQIHQFIQAHPHLVEALAQHEYTRT